MRVSRLSIQPVGSRTRRGTPEESLFRGEISAELVRSAIQVGGHFGAWREMVLNAYPDHQAKTIIFVPNRQEGWLAIRDDGTGLSPAGWENYKRLGFHFEQLGSSRHGAGGRSFFGFADQVEVVTRSETLWGDGKFHWAQFSWDEFSNGRVPDLQVKPEGPHGFPKQGTEIRISQFHDPKLTPTVAELLNWAELPPYIAERIELREGSFDALPQRLPMIETQHATLSRTTKIHGLGQVGLYLYFPKEPKPVRDKLVVGSFGRGEEWRRFASQLASRQPQLGRIIPRVFWHPGVCGFLEVEALNISRLPAGGFSEALYVNDQLTFSFVKWLRELAAEVEEHIGFVEQSVASESAKRTIQELTEDLRERFGDVRTVIQISPPSPPPPVPAFMLSPSYCEVLVGTEVEVKIRRPNPNRCCGEFDWKAEGGKLNILDPLGKQVSLNRQSVGDCFATASDRRNPELHRTVRIHYVQKRSPVFNPQTTRLHPLEERSFVIEHSSKRTYEYELEPNAGRIVSSGRDDQARPMVMIRASGQLGQGYVLEAREVGKTTEPIRATFNIEADTPDDILGIDPNRFQYDEQTFLVSVGSFARGPFYVVIDSGTDHTITLNDQHPEYAGRSGQGRIFAEYIRQIVAQAVAETVRQNGRPVVEVVQELLFRRPS